MCQALIKNGRDNFLNKSKLQIDYENLLKKQERLLAIDAK